MIKILFICHGNICRSPMALYYFQDLVRKKGLEDMFFLDSAATSTEEIGNSAHRGTREKLRQAGISCQGHQAKRYNISNMLRITGGDPDNKIHKLLEFAGSSRDVADPWYTGDFETTWNDITTGCNALLEKILCSPDE